MEGGRKPPSMRQRLSARRYDPDPAALSEAG